MAFEEGLYYTGVFTVLYLLNEAVQQLYFFLRPSSLSQSLYKDQESWALVTEITDGIGCAFAQELGKNGFNIILHDRDQQKLVQVDGQLKREHPLLKMRS